jgi:hypothetical protein
MNEIERIRDQRAIRRGHTFDSIAVFRKVRSLTSLAQRGT